MAVAAQLFRLEQLDSEIERQEADLAEIGRRRQRSPELEAAEARLNELRRQEQGGAAEQRTLESDLADVEARIKRDQTRMYGGQIVDPRELASLERELEHYRAQRDALEERLLEAMERQDELQAAVQAASGRADEARRRREEEGPALERQADALKGSLAGLRTERDALASSLDPPSLQLYQRLRRSSGHAVSAVRDGVCQWCRVAVPPKDVQHARAGSLVACGNCARILFVGR